MTKRSLMKLAAALLPLVLGTAVARDLAPGEVNGVGPERFLTAPRVLPGDVPHPCKSSQPNVAAGVQFTNHHTNALRRWGTVHFHIPGGCSDWDFVISKWQEAIGSQVTGTFAARDALILDQQIKAAGSSLSIAQSQRVANDQERTRQEEASVQQAKQLELQRGKVCLFDMCIGAPLFIQPCPSGRSVCAEIGKDREGTFFLLCTRIMPELLARVRDTGCFIGAPVAYAGGALDSSGNVERIRFNVLAAQAGVRAISEKFGATTKTVGVYPGGREEPASVYQWNVGSIVIDMKCLQPTEANCQVTAETIESMSKQRARPSLTPKL